MQDFIWLAKAAALALLAFVLALAGMLLIPLALIGGRRLAWRKTWSRAYAATPSGPAPYIETSYRVLN